MAPSDPLLSQEGGSRTRPMRDVIDMWDNTRMVVLAAISASLYAAILIPFKVLPIIPGVTELRPANAVPIVCSFLFGPAAAWGAAIGNVIGDFFTGLGPGDLFGFAGNFLYGLLPYKLWTAVTDRDPVPDSWSSIAGLTGVIFIASGACALPIGWGLNLLGFVPFSILANIILLNNFLVAAVLSPLLLRVVYPRVRRARLTHLDVAPPKRRLGAGRRRTAVLFITTAILSGLLIGNLLSTGSLPLPGSELWPQTPTRSFEVGIGLLPSLLLLILGLALL